MYCIISIILLLASFFVGGGFKFISMAAVSGLFAIADAIAGSNDNNDKNITK